MGNRIEAKIEIEYYWKCDQGIPIPELHKIPLSEDAESRISEMRKKGYYQGELNTSVRFGQDKVPEEDKDDGLTYSGWWSYVNKESYNYGKS